MEIQALQTRGKELFSRLGVDMYSAAKRDGKSLSRFLEDNDPSDEYRGTKYENTDAFSRMFAYAGIVTRSDHVRGYYADYFEAFDKSPQTRALVPEWMHRQWRKVATGRDSGNRALYASTDQPAGGLMFPAAQATDVRGQQIAPAIPLSELVAITTPIDSNTYEAFYFEDADSPAAQLRMVRVTEGAEIPRVKLTAGEHTIRLHKFGRALEVTYELLRRQRIDMVALHIARMAVQAEKDRVAAVLDVMVNGDGNANTAATTVDLTTLDPLATAGTLTLAGWIAFRMQFENPYFPTTILAQQDMAQQLMLLNTGSANMPLATLPMVAGNFGLTPINPGLGDGLRIGWTSDAPADKIVAFDNRFAIQRIVEIGSDISEVERWTTRQTQTLTMTENEGYAVLDPGATYILDVNA